MVVFFGSRSRTISTTFSLALLAFASCISFAPSSSVAEVQGLTDLNLLTGHTVNLFARSPQNSGNGGNNTSGNGGNGGNNGNSGNSGNSSGGGGNGGNSSSGDGSGNGSGNGSDNGSDIDPNDGGSRLTLIEPEIKNMGKAYIRLNSRFKFTWRFDDDTLKIKPQFLLIQLAQNRPKYTTIGNISGSATDFTWDNTKWDEKKAGFLLKEGDYWFSISDERGAGNVTDPAGRLRALDFQAHLYSKDSDYCPTCNGANGYSALIDVSIPTAIATLLLGFAMV